MLPLVSINSITQIKQPWLDGRHSVPAVMLKQRGQGQTLTMLPMSRISMVSNWLAIPLVHCPEVTALPGLVVVLVGCALSAAAGGWRRAARLTWR